ncbi:MAG: hypothetical protein R3185_07220, partial [Candidatus Thermoplasmatota archaeon]|nr:hypothetical protein [Candidatus Thermoplasmatota archaeon]
MSHPLATLASTDVRLQVRVGVYAVFALVAALFLLALHLVPAGVSHRLLPILLMGDPSLLAFFFVGGMVVVDRDGGVLEALLTTPVTLSAYMAAKVGTLSALGALLGVVVAALAASGPVAWWLLVPALFLTGLVAGLLAFVAIAFWQDVNRYFLFGGIAIIPLFAPLVPFLSSVSWPWVQALPTGA